MLYPEYYPEWTEKYPVIPKISKELVKDLWQIYGKGAIRTTSLYLRQVLNILFMKTKVDMIKNLMLLSIENLQDELSLESE